LFDKDFVRKMSYELDKNYELDRSKQSLRRSLVTCLEELDDIPFYFLSDEIASKLKTNPNSLSEIIERLKSIGHRASRTSLDPCGFKTDARIDQIMAVLK
jgi:tRNA (guanine26-N2/guanine27-N2)-dimethyltransferase